MVVVTAVMLETAMVVMVAVAAVKSGIKVMVLMMRVCHPTLATHCQGRSIP